MAKFVIDSDRFWEKVDKSPGHGPNGDCWAWVAGKNRGGYGMVRWRGRPRLAHRVAYEITHGLIDANKIIMHICDFRPCCNPSHLKAGSHLENMRDAVSKQRHAHGETHHKATFTDAQVLAIKRSLALGMYRPKLQKMLNCSRQVLINIQRGETWKHLQLTQKG